MEKRSQHLLKVLINQHIADGSPVGSKTLSNNSEIDLSPASIRNIMKNLEDEGFISSPHTSSGRIPTKKGYRYFVDSLLTYQKPSKEDINLISKELSSIDTQTNTIAETLSSLTHHAGLILIPKLKKTTFKHIEFIQLANDKVLNIMVTSDGQVMNKILTVEKIYSSSELLEFSNYFTSNFSGLTIQQAQEKINYEILSTKKRMFELMQSAMTSSENDASDNIFISGKENLMDNIELTKDLRSLKNIIQLFDKKNDLMSLLEKSQKTTGVQIFIGEESGYHGLDECSIITSPYEVDGEIIGTLGVIGPTRMAYERVIPIVDITAKLLSLSNQQRKK
jgi:heat-inducible transcriptional repressor